MTASEDNMVWIDMEMSGLDPNTDRILEVATIVTDKHLNVLAEGPVLAVHQSNDVLNNMDEWNTHHHNQSGLVARCRDSKLSERDAERKTLEFIGDYVPKGKAPLCGNSVFQDRRFMANYMQELDEFLHYRLVDVSTVKELARRWHTNLFNQVKKKNTHQALDDIRESIEELRFYRGHFFRLP